MGCFPFIEDSKGFPYKDPLGTPEIGPAGGLDDTNGTVTCKGEGSCVSIFPGADGPFGVRLEEGRPPFTEGEGVESTRCPPLGKLVWEITVRSRPSEHKGRDCGGLLSSTRNCVRSRRACRGTGSAGDAVGDTTGIKEDNCTHLGNGAVSRGGSPRDDGEDTGGAAAFGGSPKGDGEGIGDAGGLDPDRSIGGAVGARGDGLACKGVRGNAESVGFSCKLERDRGEGEVISNGDAAQSQCNERDP